MPYRIYLYELYTIYMDSMHRRNLSFKISLVSINNTIDWTRNIKLLGLWRQQDVN